MSRFFARASSGSESESSEDEQSVVVKPAPLTSRAFVFSEDEEETKRVVRSQKDKRFDDLNNVIKQLKNHKKIKDMSKVFSEFENLGKAFTKAKAVVDKEGIPQFFIRCLAELEDFVKENWEDTEGRKKLSKINAKALGTLRQKLRKYNKDFESDIEKYRENPVLSGESDVEDSDSDDDSKHISSPTGLLPDYLKKKAVPDKRAAKPGDDEESDSDDSFDWGEGEDESSSESSLDEKAPTELTASMFLKKPKTEGDKVKSEKKKVKKAPKMRDRDDDEGGTKWTVVKGTTDKSKHLFPKDTEITHPVVLKKLHEILSARGKKGTDRTEQIEFLKELRKISEDAKLGEPMTVKLMFNIVSSIFDYNPNMATCMKAEMWQECLKQITELLSILENNPDIVVGEYVIEENENFDNPETTQKVRGCVLTVVERMDNEFVKMLQGCDCHSTEYIERLKDEKCVTELIERLQHYLERKGNREELCRIYLRRIEHLYYKIDPETKSKEKSNDDKEKIEEQNEEKEIPDEEKEKQNVEKEKPDEEKEKPDEEKEKPDEEKEKQNEEKEKPDEEKEKPDEEKEMPDEEKEKPDEEKEKPDEEKEKPDEEKEMPDEEKEKPDEEKEKPDEEKEMPDEEKEKPDEEKEKPDEEKEKPDEEKETPDEEKETPDEEKETPDEEKETPDEEKEKKAEESSVIAMDFLCKYIYSKDTSDRIRTRAMLCHVYHHALHNRWFEARDLMLMSHLQETIQHSDILTQILYNRTMVQLGLCAFRHGMIRDAHNALHDVQSSGRAKELLAQGLMQQRQYERTPEQEKIEKRRQMPFHMHINLELLECVYLTSAMLLEIPFMAAHAHDYRRRIISKSFHYQLRQSDKQTLVGPPESMREHVVAASKAMKTGDWRKCRDYILAVKVWKLFSGAAKVKEMLSRKIQEESLRTYLFTYNSVYDSLSLHTLAEMFDLPPGVVHSTISKMIINEELQASWDEPTQTVVMHRGAEPTLLQNLALQLADKVGTLVENNERIYDTKHGGFFQYKDRQGQGRDYRQGDRRYRRGQQQNY